jgi:hypothetical protein
VTTSPQSPFEPAHSGLYRTPPALDLLQQAAARLGIAYFRLDLRNVGDKRDFLGACARAFGFPASFGHNWDAFADSVQDLSWHPARGYLIHLQYASAFTRAAPHDYAAAMDILGHAAAYWKARATTFIVLVDDAQDLPLFTA